MKTIEPRRLYQQVADQIRQLIYRGRFEAGTRLPSERDLAQQLGVSRPSLREALIALEIDGTVEIRMGSGVYVCPERERPPLPTGLVGESPSELMQARAIVEGSAALMATARMTPETLSILRQSIDAMRIEIEQGRKALDQDRLFHMTIARQTGNTVIARFIGELFDERHSPIGEKLQTWFESRETWSLALAEHEAIYAAFEARDPLLAQSAMHAHLESSKRRWTEA
nr:FadR/GntR family transcriptional regulator [Rhizobium setariae]